GIVWRLIQRDRARAGARQLDRLPVVRPQHDETALIHVPRRDYMPVAIARRTQLLLGDHVHVPGMPDLDVARLFVALGALGFPVPIGDADINYAPSSLHCGVREPTMRFGAATSPVFFAPRSFQASTTWLSPS